MADELAAIFGANWSPAEAVGEDGGGSYDPLPPGMYHAVIESAEVVTTKAGNGKMIKTVLSITGPTHAGRKVFDQMVVLHPNETAMGIGQKRFAALCMAAGYPTRPTLGQLGLRPVRVRLGIEKSEQYGDRNKVLEFQAAGVMVGGASSPPLDLGPEGFDDSDVPF